MAEEKKEQEDIGKKKDYKKEIKDLVIARLQVIPQGVFLSIGGEGDFGVEDLIEHVQKGDEIGKMVIEEQLDYIRSLKELSLDTEKNVPANY